MKFFSFPVFWCGVVILIAFLLWGYSWFLTCHEKEREKLLRKVIQDLSSLNLPPILEDLQNVLTPIVRAFCECFKAQYGVIAYVNPQKKNLEPFVSVSPPEAREKLSRVFKENKDNTNLHFSLSTGKIILANQKERLSGLEKELKLVSSLFIPIVKKNSVLGIIFLGSSKPRAFPAKEVDFMEIIASLLSPFFNSAFFERSYDRMGQEKEPSVLQDLEVARILQQKLLPAHLPQVEGVSIAAKLLPAKEVSGDFYDCFLLREKTLALNIGDVSGKSIPAALLVSMAKYIFRFPPSLYIRPSKLMELANKIVYSNGGGFFITDCFATLDLDRKELVYVSAGHPPVLHYRARGNQVAFLPPTGPLLGVAEDSRYREESVFLSSNDLLLFYSDGLTEIKLDNKKTLAEEGLSALFLKLKDLQPEQLVEKLLDEILHLYQAYEQERDDMTCLVLKIL
jgi:hypothetical protein